MLSIVYKMIIILLLLCVIHYCLINGLEKIIIDILNINKDHILRPIKKCKKMKNYSTYCIGMPSGHTEITTIICYILYKFNCISLSHLFLIITLMCLQRIITNKHTLLQTIIGIFFGLLYSNIYLKTGLSYKSLILSLFFVFIFINIIIYKIDNELQKQIPEWVDKQMIKNIENKKNVIYSVKVVSIISAPIRQNLFLFMSWENLEYYLDIIVKNIKNTNIKYDAIVGIKTGGAIISDYISNKLNIKNYKIKLSDIKYKCNKSSKDFYSNYYNVYIKKEEQKMITCEKIKDNLKDKNIILIDEYVSSGNTINGAIRYLLSKEVNLIYPTSVISTYNVKLINNYKLNSVLQYTNSIPIWPWGYDN